MYVQIIKSWFKQEACSNDEFWARIREKALMGTFCVTGNNKHEKKKKMCPLSTYGRYEVLQQVNFTNFYTRI